MSIWAIRVSVAAGLVVWAGATLLLSARASFSRPGLAERLRPFSPGSQAEVRPGGILSVESFRDVLSPLVAHAGDRMASLFGVTEPVGVRLRRVHSTLDARTFRFRQMSISAMALLAGGALAALVGPPPALSLLLVLGSPVLAFLVIEQQLSKASERWQLSLGVEIPVVAEQLAMLLNAGYSLGPALARLGAKGQGCAASDLRTVVNRMRQGVSATEALREWAEVARVDAVHRLVGVLALNSQASDLGRLVSVEARQARRDLHRRTIEMIERRAQQVWVPVTVATLVPGSILLAVPFLAALRLFSNA